MLRELTGILLFVLKACFLLNITKVMQAHEVIQVRRMFTQFNINLKYMIQSIERLGDGW